MNEYGFVDNFDKRYSSGWRHWLLAFGLGEVQWIRSKLGGRWERWWIDPCLSYIWHPVYCESSRETNTRPCPTWNSVYVFEEY